MTERLITVRSKPIPLETEDGQTWIKGEFPRPRPGTKIADVAVCTKHGTPNDCFHQVLGSHASWKAGMTVRVRSSDMAAPDSECYFYIKLQHSWCRSDGTKDFDEIITDGENFYIAFRSLGKVRMTWTEDLKQSVLYAIQQFTLELSS
jgi:hypothetical protein